jgi:hypothetical protein
VIANALLPSTGDDVAPIVAVPAQPGVGVP